MTTFGVSTTQFDTLLARVSRRLRTRTALRGAAIAVALNALWWIGRCADESTSDVSTSWRTPIVIALTSAVIGAALGWWTAASRSHEVAAQIERQTSLAHNLFITAQELRVAPIVGTSSAHASLSNASPANTSPANTSPANTSPANTSPATESHVASLVMQRANQLAQSINAASLFPLQRRALELAGAAALAVLILFITRNSAVASRLAPSRAVAALTGSIDISSISVRVTPPRYTHRDATTLRNPARVDVLIGSTIALSVTARADSLAVVTHDSTRTIAPSASGTFEFSLSATRDGFVALEPRMRVAANSAAHAGTRQLLGLSVHSDESPRVRIAQPARDMRYPDAKHTINVGIEADDDLALTALTLRYTKVAGAGERFTFTEGEIPVTITRANAAQWTARAQLALEPLLTEAGDLVVYRAIATDSRPGSAPVESDSYIAELVAPGGIAASGFAVDPDEDHYALSQQMVILKTERLIAKRAATPSANVADDAAQLAVEQRRVRAEFVFMMGGEFEEAVSGEQSMTDLNETTEAEAEGDLAAGRMANRGRISLLSAVRNMSRASVSLTTADLDAALTREKAALKQLQEAFARSRFLMRALSQREQLDLTRRQTGKLDSIARGTLPVGEGEPNARVMALRAILDDVMSARAPVAATSNIAPVNTSTFTLLAQRMLQVAPSEREAQFVATQLTAAAAAPVSSSLRIAHLDSATVQLSSMMQHALRPAAHAAQPMPLRTLQSLLSAPASRR